MPRTKKRSAKELGDSEKAVQAERRKIRNRESARRSRQRRADHVAELQQQIVRLTAENVALRDHIAVLGEQNSNLQQRLLSVMESVIERTVPADVVAAVAAPAPTAEVEVAARASAPAAEVEVASMGDRVAASNEGAHPPLDSLSGDDSDLSWMDVFFTAPEAACGGLTQQGLFALPRGAEAQQEAVRDSLAELFTSKGDLNLLGGR